MDNQDQQITFRASKGERKQIMAKPFSHMQSLRACVKHFSHSHPLRPKDVKEEEEIICSGCELDLSGPAYKCTKSKCDYFLHKWCFELPHELEHDSHPDHGLILLTTPAPPDKTKFTCHACGDYGTAFTYHCPACQFSLHVGCAFLPNTILHVDHEHPLTRFYSSSLGKESNIFTCDACRKEVPKSWWVYYCQDCDYGTHIGCTIPQC